MIGTYLYVVGPYSVRSISTRTPGSTWHEVDEEHHQTSYDRSTTSHSSLSAGGYEDNAEIRCQSIYNSLLRPTLRRRNARPILPDLYTVIIACE
jgi:hypothetical protein